MSRPVDDILIVFVPGLRFQPKSEAGAFEAAGVERLHEAAHILRPEHIDHLDHRVLDGLHDGVRPGLVLPRLV